MPLRAIALVPVRVVIIANVLFDLLFILLLSALYTVCNCFSAACELDAYSGDPGNSLFFEYSPDLINALVAWC
jgi:hypothetical protein